MTSNERAEAAKKVLDSIDVPETNRQLVAVQGVFKWTLNRLLRAGTAMSAAIGEAVSRATANGVAPICPYAALLAIDAN